MSVEPTEARSSVRGGRLSGRLPAVAKIAVCYGMLLWLWSPVLSSDRVNDTFQDWSYAAEYKSYATTALFDFGEMPYFAWQGRHKGHRTGGFEAFFANPETSVLSPLLPLYRVLDYQSATQAERAIRLLLGVVGAYVLLAAWLSCVSPAALAVFCLLYFGSGAVAGHTLVGHGMAQALFALPLALGLYLRAAAGGGSQRVRPAAVGCGAVLALMLYEGASHFLTHFLVFLVVYSAFVCALDRSRTRATLTALITALVSFGLLGAYKLLPMTELYWGYASDYRMGYESLRELAQQFQPFAAQVRFEHERNSYIGIVGAALFAASLLRWTRRTAPLLLTGLLFLLLTWLPVANWLQQSVPFFESQGAVTRFRIGFLIALACASAGLVDRATARVSDWASFPRRAAAIGVAVLLLLGLAADLRHQNFELRRQLLLRDPYPVLQPATIAALPFVASRNGIDIQPVRGGINWAEYRYSTSGPTNPGESMIPRVQPVGVDQLAFFGDVRVEARADGIALYPTRPNGSFGYRYHHPAVALGGWISALSLAFVAARMLWWMSPQRGPWSKDGRGNQAD